MRKFTKSPKEAKLNPIDRLLLRIYSYKNTISNRFRKSQGVLSWEWGLALIPQGAERAK